jgi:phosphoribosylaminoimidazolecarboxamide formyltransferase / IMP cyclohydrolase
MGDTVEETILRMEEVTKIPKEDKVINRALISLTDKGGIEEFAIELHDLGIEILSTGGTATRIRGTGIPVQDVSDFTGFPEMLDGRVKTLHPLVHGGILYQRDNQDHQEQCQGHGIKPIDLIVVNLYAFEKTVANPKCALDDAIENIDIGGPTMLRAAAKNWRDVTVIVDPADYPQVLAEIKEYGDTLLPTRLYLAKKVFALTAAYDTAISNWLDNSPSAKLDDQ